GVAFDWGKRKGLDVFVELAKRLPEDYKIVLVGTQEEHRVNLPSNILALGRTSSREELAQWYTIADLFVNPTRDEVFGLVNVEALACGTPGVTFNSGGSPECYDDTSGAVVPCEDIDALEKEIIRICTEKSYSEADCIKKAKEFDKNEKFKEYIELYERVNASGT
ncbi:MAG: glycosyltransferase, partial [Clostridia bacterium]|nr:glycosyltransferase [Clostridia bacterium]